MKFYTSIALALIFFASSAFAQKTFTEGIITYNISIETTKGEKQLNTALNGAVVNLFVTKDKSRTELVSTPGTETTVYDNTIKKGFILKEYSGQKLMITTNGDNWSQKNLINNKLNFSTDAGTIIIAGYTCKKANAVSADGRMFTVYYDPTVVIANKQYNNAFPQLQGLPVQYELQSGNLIFKYTLSKLNNESIANAKFDAPKSGYRVMSFEENQQLKKGE